MAQSGAEVDPHPIGYVIVAVRDIARDREKVSLGTAVEQLGPASQSGLILVPALIACGLTIAILAAQMLTPGRKLWLPGA